MLEEVLLVRPRQVNPDGSRHVVTPPIGLWSMRTNNFGKLVYVIDLDVNLGAFKPLSPIEAETVGYSALFPGHMAYLPEARAIVKAEREVIGGPTGAALGYEDMEAVFGPGENWLAGREVPFSELIPPAFDIVELQPYWRENRPFSNMKTVSRRWMVLETSRGCPHHCNYCAIPDVWGRWQARPLDMIDSYVAWLQSIGIEEINVIDDNVAYDPERFIRIIEIFKKHKMFWDASNGVYNRTLLRTDVQDALRQSECLYMALPFEAGNERSAKLMGLGKKYLTFDEAYAVASRMKELDITTAGQFIIGYPGETEDDVLRTLEYANALPLTERHIHIATPLLGTKMYRECAEKGYFMFDEGDVLSRQTYKTPVISTPMLSAEKLYEIWKKDREDAMRRKNAPR